MKNKKIGLSVASMVLGIVGLLTICIVMGIIPCIIGLILGIVALAQKQNKAMAIVGIVTSAIGLALVVLVLLLPSDDSAEIGTQNTDIGTEQSDSNNTVDVPTGEPQKDVSIESSVIYEGNDVVITLKEFHGGSNPSVDFLIENNSSLNLGINAHAYAVNKIMANDNIYSMDYDIGAGKKANATLEIDREFLQEAGIDIIKTLDILFWFYDNDKSYKEFDTGVISVTTSAYTEPISVSAGEQLYNGKGISVSYICTRPTDITYFVTNETGAYVDFDVRNISVNDFTSSETNYDLIGVILFDGCGTFIKYKPSSEFLNDNGISTIEKIDFNLGIRVNEDYSNEYLTELITLENVN